MEEKLKKLLAKIEEYDSCRTHYVVEISRYGGEWIISYKKANFEWSGEGLEATVDKAIEEFAEMIKEREEEEREYLEQQEEDYWAVQGAKCGVVKCF